MKIVSQETTQSKQESVEALVEQRQGFIRVAAETGRAAHEVERELFKRLLQLGWLLLQQFFALLGDGDEGEYVELAEGRRVKRLEKLQRREYRSIFGLLEIERWAEATFQSLAGESVGPSLWVRADDPQRFYAMGAAGLAWRLGLEPGSVRVVDICPEHSEQCLVIDEQGRWSWERHISARE